MVRLTRASASSPNGPLLGAFITPTTQAAQSNLAPVAQRQQRDDKRYGTRALHGKNE